MRLIASIFALALLGTSLSADEVPQQENGVTQLLKAEEGRTMSAVIALAPKVRYNAMVNKHAFWILESPDPSSHAQPSLMSFIAFKDRLVYSHAGNGELFKKCAVFRLRDSLQLVSGQSLWGDDGDYEGGMLETEAGDIYLACNLDLLFFLDEQRIEQILTSSPSIFAAATAIAYAAKSQGAGDRVHVALIQLPASDK